MQLTGNSQIRVIVELQAGAAIAIGLVLLVLGKTAACSGLTGGLIAALANGFFALRSFVHYRAQDPGKIASRMLGAEIQKLVLTGLMFTMAIVAISPLSIGALLGGYLCVQVAVPLIVLVFQDRQKS
ncbi:MAG: ATP synthase subunit I [Candidatus Thiodiazotropha sp. (ex Epidulcina cf. delphinae)]|nr:ATP synthase subunit I [Candidatus Thiodiazotropha sp. (ex Epidulcina cf. delphinae)]